MAAGLRAHLADAAVVESVAGAFRNVCSNNGVGTIHVAASESLKACEHRVSCCFFPPLIVGYSHEQGSIVWLGRRRAVSGGCSPAPRQRDLYGCCGHCAAEHHKPQWCVNGALLFKIKVQPLLLNDILCLTNYCATRCIIVFVVSNCCRGGRGPCPYTWRWSDGSGTAGQVRDTCLHCRGRCRHRAKRSQL